MQSCPPDHEARQSGAQVVRRRLGPWSGLGPESGQERSQAGIADRVAGGAQTDSERVTGQRLAVPVRLVPYDAGCLLQCHAIAGIVLAGTRPMGRSARTARPPGTAGWAGPSGQVSSDELAAWVRCSRIPKSNLTVHP